jgi:hypothetical protein
MALWKIEPTWKKSIVERQYYHNGDNTVVQVIIYGIVAMM